jgi:hypothetical protein
MDQAETEKETSFSLMVVSPFLGPSARDRLKDEENSFADLTGNLRLATDLLTGPGRNPAEAESLIEWMRGNLEKWQIQEFH